MGRNPGTIKLVNKPPDQLLRFEVTQRVVIPRPSIQAVTPSPSSKSQLELTVKGCLRRTHRFRRAFYSRDAILRSGELTRLSHYDELKCPRTLRVTYYLTWERLRIVLLPSPNLRITKPFSVHASTGRQSLVSTTNRRATSPRTFRGSRLR